MAFYLKSAKFFTLLALSLAPHRYYVSSLRLSSSLGGSSIIPSSGS
jgi:hypothetical protein